VKLDDALRARLIDGVIAVLEKEYVYPDVVAKVDKRLRANVNAKRYDKVQSPEKLAELLTEDLQEVTRDKHLWVGYSAEPVLDDPN